MTSSPTVISSRDNPLVKELRRLLLDGSAYRKTGRVWVEGEHLCEAAAARGWIADLAVASESNQHFSHAAYVRSAIKSVVISDAIMREISGLESVAGVGLLFTLPKAESLQRQARSVILDRLQDPGNAGSILRSAAAFGYTQVIALKGTVALWSPKVLRAGMGAHFSLQILEAASVDQLTDFGLPLAVTSSHRGIYLHELKTKFGITKSGQVDERKDVRMEQMAWIFGHEGQGVSAELEAMAQVHVRIVQPGGQESLNVAAAAAICMHASAAASVMSGQ